MKLFLIAILASLSCLTGQDQTRLKGNYRLEFDKKYELSGYKINFNDDTFEKVMPDAVSYKGKLKYEKYKVIVRLNADEHPIEIDNREFSKDTMVFTTKNKADLSRTMNRGKMIKVK